MISIIIPTRNRARLLGSTILSLIAPSTEQIDCEIIVVDNGSTDNTRETVAALARLARSCRYVFEPRPGLHFGRHAGLREAKGSILAYLDDDVEVASTWLPAIEEGFRDPDTVLLGGNMVPIFYGMPPGWLCEIWNGDGGEGVRAVSSLSIQEHPQGKRLMDPYLVWGCNFAIRKETLLAAGGFHPDGMPESEIRFRGDGETHVSRYVEKNNLKCVFDSRASVYHKVTPDRMSVEYFRKRGFSQGISDSYASLRGIKTDLQNGSRGVGNVILSNLSAVVRRALVHILPRASENPARAAFRLGYNEGYAYHQAAYHADVEVRDWVHKQGYL